MPRITGGQIDYAERRTIAQYEHKECKVSFQFAFDEAETPAHVTAALDKIQEEVRHRVRVQLGLSKPEEAPKAVAAPAPVAAPAAPPAPPADKPKRGRPAKPAAAAPADEPDLDDAPPATKPAADEPPAEDEDFDSVDEDFDAPAAPAAKTVTDAELVKAVQERNAVLKKPTAIRGLIAKFGATQVTGVKANEREAFLLELAALA